MSHKIKPETLKFLSDLIENNYREWFDENKQKYQNARANFIDFLNDVLAGINQFDASIEEQAAKDTVYRIYRDIRFSNDKTPYKNHFGSYIAEGGRKSVFPGYYIHLSPHNKSFLAGGLWMPPAAELKATRQEIDYNWQEFQDIIHKPAFIKLFGEVEGEKLKTTPKGYTTDNPAINMLRFKSWNVTHALTDQQVLSTDFADYAVNVFKEMKDFNDFLKRGVADIAS